MKQLDLFGAAPTRVIVSPLLSDPGRPTRGAHHTIPRDTEKAAALRVWPRTGTQRLAVLHALANAGPRGLTDPEIAERTGLYLYSAAPRRNELLEGGWLEDSRERRDTGRGGNAIVWRLNPDGLKAYAARMDA